METPESKLESKYFIEGEADARGGDEKNYSLGEITLTRNHATRILLLASRLSNM
jgi:hypothetical protein